MIAVTVLAILATVGVPTYQRALRTARTQKATCELRTISTAIDVYRTQNNVLPASLHEVGFGGRLDPWGVPYCFLNYETGTGDGLQWAVDVGLVDPAILVDSGTGAKIDPGTPLPPGVAVAIADPASGSPLFGKSLYLGVPVPSVRRRDRYLFPLNTDYDLFSLGPDGRTTVAIGSTMSLDDVIRANDGGFFGTAANY